MSEQMKVNQVTEMSVEELDMVAGGAGGAASETDLQSDFEKEALVEEFAAVNGEKGSAVITKTAKVDINSELDIERLIR